MAIQDEGFDVTDEGASSALAHETGLFNNPLKGGVVWNSPLWRMLNLLGESFHKRMSIEKSNP